MSDVVRVALVTGGGSGMGKAASLRLPREGKAVGVLYIDAAVAAEVAALITEAGGRTLAVIADAAFHAQVDQAVGIIREALGPITILINNVATENFSPFAEIDEANRDRLIAVNLKGSYILVQTVLPDMLAAGLGAHRQLVGDLRAEHGALYGHQGRRNRHDAVTRGGAWPKAITVNSVSPGFIDTPMSRRAIDGDKFPVPYEQILASFPIPRLGTADEIAAACAFFASEDAGYVTGQLLGVNGGAAS